MASAQNKAHFGKSREPDLTEELDAQAFFRGVCAYLDSKLVSLELTWRYCIVAPGGMLKMYDVKKPQIFRGEVDLKNMVIEQVANKKTKIFDRTKLPPPLTKDTIIEGERAYLVIKVDTGRDKRRVSSASRAAGRTYLCVSSTKAPLWLEGLVRGTKLGPVMQRSSFATPLRESSPTGESSTGTGDSFTGALSSQDSQRDDSSSESNVPEDVPKIIQPHNNFDGEPGARKVFRSPADIFNALASSRNAPPADRSTLEGDSSTFRRQLILPRPMVQQQSTPDDGPIDEEAHLFIGTPPEEPKVSSISTPRLNTSVITGPPPPPPKPTAPVPNLNTSLDSLSVFQSPFELDPELTKSPFDDSPRSLSPMSRTQNSETTENSDSLPTDAFSASSRSPSSSRIGQSRGLRFLSSPNRYEQSHSAEESDDLAHSSDILRRTSPPKRKSPSVPTIKATMMSFVRSVVNSQLLSLRNTTLYFYDCVPFSSPIITQVDVSNIFGDAALNLLTDISEPSSCSESAILSLISEFSFKEFKFPPPAKPAPAKPANRPTLTPPSKTDMHPKSVGEIPEDLTPFNLDEDCTNYNVNDPSFNVADFLESLLPNAELKERVSIETVPAKTTNAPPAAAPTLSKSTSYSANSGFPRPALSPQNKFVRGATPSSRTASPSRGWSPTTPSSDRRMTIDQGSESASGLLRAQPMVRSSTSSQLLSASTDSTAGTPTHAQNRSQPTSHSNKLASSSPAKMIGDEEQVESVPDDWQPSAVPKSRFARLKNSTFSSLKKKFESGDKDKDREKK